MATVCSTIQQSLAWCQGTPELPGIKRRIYYISKDQIVSWPTLTYDALGRLTIVPLYNKMDSKFIHVTAKSNMLVGYDQMSDVESILVKEYEPFILSYIATMFFGVQFESIDYRRMKVIELAA